MACNEARDVPVLSHDGTGREGSVTAAWGAVWRMGENAPPGGDMHPCLKTLKVCYSVTVRCGHARRTLRESVNKPAIICENLKKILNFPFKLARPLQAANNNRSSRDVFAPNRR